MGAFAGRLAADSERQPCQAAHNDKSYGQGLAVTNETAVRRATHRLSWPTDGR